MSRVCVCVCVCDALLLSYMCISHLQCGEGEVFVVQGEQMSNSDFDTTFLDEKSNLNRLDSGVFYMYMYFIMHVHV